MMKLDGFEWMKSMLETKRKKLICTLSIVRVLHIHAYFQRYTDFKIALSRGALNSLQQRGRCVDEADS